MKITFNTMLYINTNTPCMPFSVSPDNVIALDHHRVVILGNLGLIGSLLIKLNHPSCHQLQMVFQRQFFTLDMTDAISHVTSACHMCASLKSFPSTLVSQSSDDPPVVIGISFAADVIKRHCQFILVLRECSTSLTASCLIPDKKHDTLRDALTKLIVSLHPLDGFIHEQQRLNRWWPC